MPKVLSLSKEKIKVETWEFKANTFAIMLWSSATCLPRFTGWCDRKQPVILPAPFHGEKPARATKNLVFENSLLALPAKPVIVRSLSDKAIWHKQILRLRSLRLRLRINSL